MSEIQGKAPVFHNASTALPFPSVHGTATGVRSSAPGRAKSRGQKSHSTKFFVGEVLGTLFILLVTGYTLMVPSVISKSGTIMGFLDRVIKRTFDIVGSIAGLILTLPIWIILPFLIKLDSSGPVFYTQVRVGVNRRKGGRRYHNRGDSSERRLRDRRRHDIMGKPFSVIKFRTMCNDAEQKSGPVWAQKNDPRITRLGSIMRKTRLDEIPQFINILFGDMSLVGPRPERPTFVADLSGKVSDYAKRLDVKPGLTGLAQVESGYDSSISSVVEKVHFDLQYIRNWSIFADVKILLKTVVVVFTGRGAC